MQTLYSQKFSKNVVTIHPGEYYVTAKDEIIATLLGSCVAVCLMDLENKIAGMNHYMLEGKVTNGIDSYNSKHSLHSTYKLIDHMLRSGAEQNKIQAKIFGGGNVLKTGNTIHNISGDNIKAAKVILELEDIPILFEDTGGKFTRKIFMDAHSGKVFLHKTEQITTTTSI